MYIYTHTFKIIQILCQAEDTSPISGSVILSTLHVGHQLICPKCIRRPLTHAGRMHSKRKSMKQRSLPPGLFASPVSKALSVASIA